ncbi:MAG: hypothetical protein RTU92_13485 [Candidatus Thorarchaeota archaeon]
MPVKYPDRKSEDGVTCAYCGKTGIKIAFIRTNPIWRDPRNYCSMKCFAKGDRKIVALLTIFLVPIYIVFGVVVLLASEAYYQSNLYWMSVRSATVLGVILLIGLHCCCIYIGFQNDDTPYDERKDDWDGVRTYDPVE